MKQFHHSGLAAVSLVLVLLQFTFTHASYCEDSNCCAYNGPGNKTCQGPGTSDTSDLLGYMVKGDGQILIVGAQYGIYWVWRVKYYWLEGAFANLFVNSLYGYCLEVPKSNYTEHTYYFIQVTSCPSITVLTNETKGNLPTTSLLYSTLYKAITRFAAPDPSCPGPCNVVSTSYQFKYPDFFNSLFVGQSSISLFASSLISFEYDSLKGCSRRDPLKIAKKYGLKVKKGTCPSTYVLGNYPSGVIQKCNNPNPTTPEGVALVEKGFNFTLLNGPAGGCALSEALGTLYAASTSYSFLVSFRRVTLLREPYDELFTLNLFSQSNDGLLSLQPLYGLC